MQARCLHGRLPGSGKRMESFPGKEVMLGGGVIYGMMIVVQGQPSFQSPGGGNGKVGGEFPSCKSNICFSSP